MLLIGPTRRFRPIASEYRQRQGTLFLLAMIGEKLHRQFARAGQTPTSVEYLQIVEELPCRTR